MRSFLMFLGCGGLVGLLVPVLTCRVDDTRLGFVTCLFVIGGLYLDSYLRYIDVIMYALGNMHQGLFVDIRNAKNTQLDKQAGQLSGLKYSLF
jgi:hypothetical protein